MPIEILVILVCLSLNAILACIEMAFVSVGRPELRQLAQKGNRDAVRLLGLRENPERTLSVLQVGITLVGVISAAVGGAGAEESLTPWLQRTFQLREAIAEIISVVLVVVPITFLNVVVGELVPKTIALKRPMTVALFSSRWLALADAVLSPIVGLLEWSTKKLLQLFLSRFKPDKPAEASSVELASLSDQHRQYVVNLVQLEKKQARDVMVPWERVATLNFSATMQEATSGLLSCGHSRMPVLDGNEVKGFLYSKEFMMYGVTGSTNWTSILRPILVVRDTDSLLRIMRLMQERRNHISLVYSADHKRVGIVSLEDILEEVVGEIYDEDDDGRLKTILASSGRLRFSQTRRGASGLFDKLAPAES